MTKKRVLYAVCGGTLGHVKRSVTIARALCRHDPEIDISWLVHKTEAAVLEEAGEVVLPESAELVDTGVVIEHITDGYTFNLARWSAALMKTLRSNFEIYKRLIRDRKYDLLVGDTAFEIDF